MQFPLLNGAGVVAHQEASLMINATLLMLIVAVPVLVLLFFFAWYYRAGNTKAKYVPEWEHSKMDELVWWAVPLEIVLVLAALTWASTHTLDPRRPLEAAQGGALTIQAVALPWKWLFIYPAQGVAAVNYVPAPAGVPLRFEITADAPMNSFWVPALGGQVYAMTGMANTLYLMADAPGDYPGRSANYSGEGFADMRFIVHATSQAEFDAWVARARLASSTLLDQAEYDILSYPATSTAGYYGAVEPGIFDSILAKFDWGFMGGRHH